MMMFIVFGLIEAFQALFLVPRAMAQFATTFLDAWCDTFLRLFSTLHQFVTLALFNLAGISCPTDCNKQE